MEHRTEEVTVFLRRTVRLHRLFSLFRDIRRDPVIPLKNLLGMVFCMPFFGQSTMLAADRDARRKRTRSLFDAEHRRDGVQMVASDSTLQRALRWLDPQPARRVLFEIARRLDRMGLLTARLSEHSPRRRLGIVDGSVLGKFYAVCVTLLGTVRVPLLIEPTGGRGKELPVAQRLVKQAATALGAHAPTLWLADALYFTSGFFSLIRNDLHAHLLIKCKDPEFRDVLTDARQLFENRSAAVEPVASCSGFDTQRWCSWRAEKTSGEFAGFPVQVVRLQEQYPKRHRNHHIVTWIVTTDPCLSCREVREAAHLRWQIENNVFKRMSHLCGTKRFWSKDQRAYFTMVRLFAAAVAAFDAFISILRTDQVRFKRIMAGAKFTWKNFFSQLEEQLSELSIARVLATS
ncbi:MAG: hypothetical protein KAU31_00915 [Spirochaetaceae bacterium]|nr:hypothetical protein [Spirochaetaceae bacterium]